MTHRQSTLRVSSARMELQRCAYPIQSVLGTLGLILRQFIKNGGKICGGRKENVSLWGRRESGKRAQSAVPKAQGKGWGLGSTGRVLVFFRP